MIHPFDPRYGLIIVPAKVFGPTGDTIVRLALDTGATVSLINADVLLQAESGVDGVLGLDFLRGRKLTLDFRIGLITLE